MWLPLAVSVVSCTTQFGNSGFSDLVIDVAMEELSSSIILVCCQDRSIHLMLKIPSVLVLVSNLASLTLFWCYPPSKRLWPWIGQVTLFFGLAMEIFLAVGRLGKWLTHPKWSEVPLCFGASSQRSGWDWARNPKFVLWWPGLRTWLNIFVDLEEGYVQPDLSGTTSPWEHHHLLPRCTKYTILCHRSILHHGLLLPSLLKFLTLQI